ncbi:MAG: ABC transporter substrate-binding protein [Terriglobales bacterium]
MKRIASLLLALISLACVATAETRPHYGGTLRVAMQSAPNALVLPAASDPSAYWDMARLLSLVGDNLIGVDAEGRPHPALAVAWQHDSTSRHWQFTLRRGVKFHDNSLASPAAIAQILGALHPNWKVQGGKVQASQVFAGASYSKEASMPGGSLTIDTDTPALSLLAELALPRNLILTRNAAGIPIGTGPFRVTDFQPGESLKLVSSDESWSGRPFIDGVEIEFGKSLREQALELELGRADMVEATPATASAAASRVRLSSSLPVELMALIFTANSNAQDARVREALALSIDRKPIQFVLLKGAAEPTAGILPNWMTGYSPAFPAQPDVARAKALLADSRPRPLTLSYDPRDPQSQLIAERIALNAREVGITVQVSMSGADDLRLVRIALVTSDPALALREAARELSLPEPALRGDAVEDLYQAERSLLDGNPVIPLFHLPVATAVSTRVRGWTPNKLGLWNLADISLETGHEDSR